jgi:hypothetical protein
MTHMCKKPTRYFVGLKMAICFALFFRVSESAVAQRSLDKERPFDGVPGILISCQSDKNMKWTEDACTYLITEVKRRAAESKMGVSVQPSSPDMAKKKFGQTDGFDGDKAIRMAWTFEESSSEKGRVNVELVSHRIWEATEKEKEAFPALGSRRSELFYMQDIIYDPGTSFNAAKKAMNTVLDTFFQYGEGKVKGTKF